MSRYSFGRVVVMCAVLMAVLFAAPLAAGTRQEYRFLGFSPDGFRVAWEVYGVHDGSGFPFYSLHLSGKKPLTVHFEGNDATMDRESVTSFRARALAQAAGSLRTAGIDRERTGRLASSEMRTNGDTVSLRFAPSSTSGRMCTVRLRSRESGAPHEHWGMRSRSICLEVSYMGKTLLLYKDGKQENRSQGTEGFCFGYGLLEVREYRGYLVVVVTRSTPGFEGPDTGIMFSHTDLRSWPKW